MVTQNKNLWPGRMIVFMSYCPIWKKTVIIKYERGWWEGRCQRNDHEQNDKCRKTSYFAAAANLLCPRREIDLYLMSTRSNPFSLGLDSILILSLDFPRFTNILLEKYSSDNDQIKSVVGRTCPLRLLTCQIKQQIGPSTKLSSLPIDWEKRRFPDQTKDNDKDKVKCKDQ